MNTPVSFEIAKLLKEKGFNEPCRWYMEDGVTLSGSNETNDYLFPGYYSAPTIAEVVMWLYEKHGIWIDVSLNQFSKPNDLQWMYSILFTKDCTYSHSQKSFNSPKEAYEAAIIYTLKNLI